MAESTLQGLIGEIKEFLEWIKDTLEDDEVRKSLLEDVGLEPTDPPPKPNVPQDKLDSIGRYQQTVDADKAALDSTLSDLRAVFDSVRSFISSFSLSPALVGEVTNRFLNLLALNYIRLRKPKLFVAAQAASFVEDTGAPFLSGKITWKNIVKACTDGGSYLRKTILIALDDEEEAQARSDFYFVPLAAFLAFAFKQNNRSLYGWDPAPESGTPQGDAISRRMLSSVFFSTERDPATGQTVEKRINTTLYFLTTPQGGPGMFLTLGGGGALEASLSERWKALLEVSSPSVVDMTIFGEKIFTIRGPLGGPPNIRASAALQSIPDQTNRSFVLPSDSDTHFEVGTIELVATVSADEIDLDATEAEIKLSLHECAVVIATKDNDGFLSSLLPDEGLRLPFNFGLGASRKRGLYTEGNVPFLSGRSTRALRLARDTASQDGKPVPIAGAIGKGFNASIPIGVALGPVELHSLQLKLTPNDTAPDTSDIVAEASASLILRLGPAYISIDRLGFELKLAFPEKGIGNLGLADLSLGPALPRGVAISIESSAVTGGGFLFLDQPRGLYAGVVQLNLESGLAVSALGIIATRLPDGSKGFSLLVVITAEGFKPIPLGLGFKLTGIGGMLAINRTFNEDVLREGVKNHTLDSVLFPANPVRDALQLLSGLNKVFPIAPGHHLFGPMVEIEWATPDAHHDPAWDRARDRRAAAPARGGSGRGDSAEKGERPAADQDGRGRDYRLRPGHGIARRGALRVAPAEEVRAHGRNGHAAKVEGGAELRAGRWRSAPRVQSAGKFPAARPHRDQSQRGRQPADHLRRLFRRHLEHGAVRRAGESLRRRSWLQHRRRHRLRRAHPARSRFTFSPNSTRPFSSSGAREIFSRSLSQARWKGRDRCASGERQRSKSCGGTFRSASTRRSCKAPPRRLPRRSMCSTSWRRHLATGATGRKRSRPASAEWRPCASCRCRTK